MYCISGCRSRTATLLVSFSRFLRSRNSMESFSRLYKSALNTLTSRDDVIHDVKVSCIVSRVVEVVQQLYWYRFQLLRSRNSMESFPKTVRSALNTLTSRDDVIHDVKVSCIVSRVVEVVQQLYWYRFQGF